MPRPTFTLTFPAFPDHVCRPVSALSPEEHQQLMAEVNGIYRTIFAALDAHTDAHPDTRQLAYIMAAHAVKLALEGEETAEPEPAEPVMLTDAELAAVNTLYAPIDVLLDQYIETSPDYPYDTILEALARLTDYYEGMQAYVDAEIEKDIAAEESDA
jgi:hypothetical protein